MDKKPLISYILPTYQAESFISNNLNLFSRYCAESEYDSEIIIVNDGSSDRTNDHIEAFLNEKTVNPVIKYVNLPVNRGKGAAIKEGLEVAEGKYIVFTDCDLQYSFENMEDVVKSLINDKSNIVIASRMHKDSIYKIRSRNIRWIYIRHTAGRIFNLFINVLTGLRIEDTQAGLKGIDRSTADLVFGKMTIPGFSFDIDILVCARENKKKISSIPIEFNYDSEMTTINFIKQTFIMTLGLLKVVIKKQTGTYKK